jgi:hypothetical protein
MKIDASIGCFVIVMMLAIPVATLRTKTFAVGYELGKLKDNERELRQRNTELKSTLASLQRSVRDRYINQQVPRRKGDSSLILPEAYHVIHGRMTFDNHK